MENQDLASFNEKIDFETHKVLLTVRDYECDQWQGVNNAVYLNYLEHCRWEYIRKYLKWDTNEFIVKNIGFVVAKLEIEFKRSLVACDNFVVETKMQRLGNHRFNFKQEFYLMNGDEKKFNKPIAKANVMIVSISTVTLKPETPEFLDNLLVGFPVVESV